MKKKCIAVFLALALAVGLVGCSRRSEKPDNSSVPEPKPTASMSANHEEDNDSFEGGGAGGTESKDPVISDRPDASPDVTDGGMLDDIGDGAGDMMDGVGDAIRDAGDAIGNAARKAGDALK